VREFRNSVGNQASLDAHVAASAEESAEHERTPGKRTLLSGPVRRYGRGVPGKVTRVELELLMRGGGRPLPGPLRGRLARSLGDLDDVRVHTGSDADRAARLLSAEAFTVGRDIFFAAGKYDPASSAGQRLIAHEAAHTAQAGASAAASSSEVEVSSPGDAHEVQADRFAEEFVASHAPAASPPPAAPAAGPPRERSRIISPYAAGAPRLVAPVRFGGLSRSPLSSSLPSTHGVLSVSPVKLFDGDSFDKSFTHVAKTIPIAKGVFPVGGIPVTYDAEANVGVGSSVHADYGPGWANDIGVELSAAESVAHGLADDDPIIGVSPLGPFGPTIGIGPSPQDIFDKAVLLREHDAHGKVSASASASLSGSATAGISGSVHALDIFGGGAYGSLGASADASASARAELDARFKYKNGTVTLTSLTLSADFDFAWNLKVFASAGVFVEIKMPNIPVISDLSEEVSSWPVIGWMVPNLKKVKWRKDFAKSWDLFNKQGFKHWKKDWQLVASGSSPSVSHPMSMLDATGDDIQGMLKDALDGKAPSADIPAEHEGPDKELKDGASSGAVAGTRQAAKAQLKSARESITREKHWNKKALTKVKAAIKKAAAKAPKPAAAGAAASPTLAIGGGAGGSGGTPDEQREVKLEARDKELEKADKGAQEVDKLIDRVKSEAESLPSGPERNEAREGFEALGTNADKLGQAVGGYGEETAGKKALARPEDNAVAAKPHAAEAEAARVETRRQLDEALEKVDTELIRADKEWANVNGLHGVDAYARKLDSYRADIKIQSSRPLAQLNKDWDAVGGFDSPDDQIALYSDIKRDAASALAKFDTLKLKVPDPPWDKKWVVPEDHKLMLIPSHRASRPIRNTMYRDYKKGTLTWLDGKLEKRPSVKFPGKTEWKYSEADPVSESTGEPHWWLLDGPDNEKPTIAHDHPSVGNHWNGPGRLTTQDARATFMDGLEGSGAGLTDDARRDKNLGIEPKRVNSIKANKFGVVLQPDVGVDFRGPK